MAHACGIEFSDFGFNAAIVSDDGRPTSVAGGSHEWPAFASWEDDGLIFGRDAERRSRLHPRSSSHTFWEHLSLAASDLEGPARTPTHSELAFTFLNAFWEEMSETAGKPSKVALALPGQMLGGSDADDALGIILAMARDMGLPLTAISGLSIAALNDLEVPAAAAAEDLLYMDIHLHSAAMSIMHREADGSVHRRQHLRLPRLGYVPLLQGLTRAMANRFLRATAFDVTVQRELEQAFYEQTRAQLLDLSGNADLRYLITVSERTHQAAFPRDAMLRDLKPLEDGYADAAAKHVGDAGLDPARVTVALSSRVSMLPRIEEALTSRGFARIVRLPEGAAARGAARFAHAMNVCDDVAEVPMVSQVILSGGAAAGDGPGDVSGVTISRTPAAQPVPGLMPSHLVIDGLAYPLPALPEKINGGMNGSGPLLPGMAAIGDAEVRLERRAGEWVVATAGPAGEAVQVSPGDRVTLRSPAGGEVELLFAAERRPGAI